MHQNYATRLKIALMITGVLGLTAVAIGSFIAQQDKTIGTVVVLSGLGFMAAVSVSVAT